MDLLVIPPMVPTSIQHAIVDKMLPKMPPITKMFSGFVSERLNLIKWCLRNNERCTVTWNACKALAHIPRPLTTTVVP